MAQEFVPLVSVLISFVSVCLVVVQLRHYSVERNLESLIQVHETNRELLTLGFSNPELFEILMDSDNVNPVWEKRYLQLWLNQLSLIHAFQTRGIFREDLREALKRDIRDFMAQQNMRKHWRGNGHYYSASFRSFIEKILEEIDHEPLPDRGTD